MSKLEDLLWSAEEYGKRPQMFKEIHKIRTENPKLTLEQQYEQAYQKVMKTQNIWLDNIILFLIIYKKIKL